jgi:hypothetical protein
VFAWLTLPDLIGLIRCIYDRDIPDAGLVHYRLVCMYTNFVGLTHCIYWISCRRVKYILNTRNLHGYPYKLYIGLTHCTYVLSVVKVRGSWSPASRPTKVGFIRLPGPAHNNFNMGSRALARGVGSFRPIITYMKGRGRFAKSVQGASHYNMQGLKYKFLGLVLQRYGWAPQQFLIYCLVS